MRKTIKKALSMLLSAAMVLTAGGVGTVVNSTVADAEDDATYAAHFTYADANWGYQIWNAGDEKAKDASVVVKEGTESYTVSMENTSDAKVPGAVVFCIDVDGLTAAATEAGYAITLDDFKLTIDGNEVATDAAKLVTGDIEGNGNYRIELYNEYGPTKEEAEHVIDMSTFEWEKSVEVTFTITMKELPSYAAHFTYADAAWGYQIWNAGDEKAKDAKVFLAEGTKTYTVSMENTSDAKVPGAVVFCIDVDGLTAAATEAGYAITLDDFKLTVDGNEVATDATKLVTGDIEENGNYRIELYNEYGPTKEEAEHVIDMSTFEWEKSVEVAFTITIKVDDNPPATDDPAEPTDEPSDDPDFEYDAFLYYQMTDTWDYRNFDDASTMYAGKEQVDPDEKAVDAVLTADGEYTVIITGVDLTGAPSYNMLGVSTNIPTTVAGVTCVGTVKVDGEVVPGLENVNLPYQTDKDCYIFSVTGYDDWANSSEIPFAFQTLTAVPQDTIEITFTITGLKEAPDTPDTPGEDDPSTDTKNPVKKVTAAKKSVSVKKGKTKTVTFKVTAKNNNKKTTSKVTATVKNKKIAKVTKTVTKKGKVVITVKGVKKGNTVLTVKVGSKKATTKVKVK